MLGLMGAGALTAAITAGGSTGASVATTAGGAAPAGSTAATVPGTSIASIAGGAVPNLPTIAGTTPALATTATALPGAVTGAVTGAAGAAGSSLLSKILPSIISTGGSLLSGALGANAANNAAQVQSQAALQAAQLQAKTAADALAFNKQVLAQQQANSQPWITAGSTALSQLGALKPFVAPDPKDVLNDPAIQFQLQQGAKTLQESAAGKGSLYSGSTLKALDQFGQGTAAQGYQNLYNRDLSTYNANLNPLLSIAGLGQVSTSGLNSNLSTGAQNNSTTSTTSAANVGHQLTNSAAAIGSGYVGSTNSWLNSIGNISNNLTGATTGGISIAQLIAALNQKAA